MCAAGAFRGAPASITATRAPCPAEHKSCAQAGCAAADHHHVVVGIFMRFTGPVEMAGTRR
jgi:hypothetical protein